MQGNRGLALGDVRPEWIPEHRAVTGSGPAVSPICPPALRGQWRGWDSTGTGEAPVLGQGRLKTHPGGGERDVHFHTHQL